MFRKQNSCCGPLSPSAAEHHEKLRKKTHPKGHPIPAQQRGRVAAEGPSIIWKCVSPGKALPGQEHHLLEKGFIALGLCVRCFPRHRWNVEGPSSLEGIHYRFSPCRNTRKAAQYECALCKKEGDGKLAANGYTFCGHIPCFSVLCIRLECELQDQMLKFLLCVYQVMFHLISHLRLYLCINSMTL